MSSLVAGACKLVITYALLFVKKVQIAPAVCLGHAEALFMASTKYLVDQVGMHVFSILAGSHVRNQEILCLGQLPKLLIWFVDNNTFSSNYAKNPFSFKHYVVV